MLPVRLGVVVAVAALCLWGLFSLLESLNKPELLRSAKAVVVKGCDSPESGAQQQCAALFCQKALLDQKLVPLNTRFQTDQSSVGSGGQWVVNGQARTPGAAASVAFSCKGTGRNVNDARRVSGPAS
ncbi:MAG TPA: hypothetical protein VKB34_14135 [Povalibacter sp.]|nr:hypothetical protein [Povalibacter sp.]